MSSSWSMGWRCCRFLAACVLTLAFSRQGFAAIDNPEVEPNDSKATATPVASGGAGLNGLDTVSGTSTGAGSGGGSSSADYFLLKTVSRAVGVYKYQLVLTSATPGHTVTVRGLSQNAGVIAAGSDVTMQTGIISASGFPADSRMIQWYGLGKQEQVYVRVTGTAGTTDPYTMELQVTSVGPTVLAGTVYEGTATTGRGTGNTNDVDFWMYNGSLTAIGNYGNDQPNSLTRSYTPGTYYIAMSDANFANSSASPADDSNRAGNVLDFPDALINATTSSALNMNAKVVSAAGTASGSGTKPNPFDITWYCFSVVPNTISTIPQGSANASASDMVL